MFSTYKTHVNAKLAACHFIRYFAYVPRPDGQDARAPRVCACVVLVSSAAAAAAAIGWEGKPSRRRRRCRRVRLRRWTRRADDDGRGTEP